jgi:hypothetical protein
MGNMVKVGSLLTSSARYCECLESGSVSDSIDAGVRTRVVTNVYQCYKDEALTILAGMDTRPAALLSAGGRNPDGTPANYVNWGAGFEIDGVGVSEISPNFSKLSVRYKATDPTGAAGTAATGDKNGCIIGRVFEGGRRYCETTASGKVEDSRVYLSDSFGWNLSRQVDVALICEKSDARVVADSLALAPASLTTNPYAGASIAWGNSYSLVSIYGAPTSPSFYAVTAKYRRNKAWAIAYPPSGMVLACTAGVCSLVWGGVKFEELDSGDPTNTTGLDVQIINGYTILMKCNNIAFSDFTPSITTGDKVLEWVIDGGNAKLMFMNEIWKEFQI